MRTQKGLSVLFTASLLVLNVACSDHYEEGLADGKAEGYASGYDVGYDEAYAEADAASFERAKAYFLTATYDDGVRDGKAVGLTQGYNSGYAAGELSNQPYVTAAYNNGYSNGYDDGYDDGVDDGYDMGYDDGVDDGYDMGYDDGVDDYYDVGYDDGFDDGYDVGYDDGWDDGYDSSFSVGKSKALKGYANLLSMAHNDLFDYSKIAAPKMTSRGVVANGKFLFEETSLTKKDTLKRQAVVEEYLILQMAKQVKSKFGLSNERSLKVAKASNHFRKYASKRALTNEDTNAYVTEMIGVDLKTIEAAHEAGNMKSVLDAAAVKNGTTPEKMAAVLAKHFI
jgi:flagellar biosynthesis/type III secretory pathway protein FliH